ncbi:sulfate/molybdate ABC transporter ATP-binding protein [Clostridium sp. PL3]|uniref:Sulfate/molybdate ABC transporter ATP-binding protein n=1 Tax=Clostridium thailandense TaxID=2794346 RepID=A0A949TUM3_9CLOT|nr:sulfate/molybdate ABC transporter ATP-binding protein [Clostridium thailandense]MBV7273776.1 sulfate/molybdate ABC transporter ATP-binding protein [Clostridium thailandense]
MGIYVDIEKNLPEFNLKVTFNTNEEIIGLLGASGSGKSMTLRCIAGLETPTKGRIVLNDRVLYDSDKKINIKANKRKVGFLFQNYALFPHMTVVENIRLGLKRFSKKEQEGKVKEKIELMQLEGLESKFPNQLSGGQQQRVALARTLAVEPEILLLDEPFSAIDNHLKSKLERQIIDSLLNYKGNVIFVSHNLEEIYRMCENLVVLSKGKMSACGSKEKIFSKPPTLSAAQLTGCKNISRVRILDKDYIEALDWGCKLKIKDSIKASVAYAGIRAHHIHIGDFDGEDNTFKGIMDFVREGPFTVTVYLKIIEEETKYRSVSLQLELTKEEWIAIKDVPQPWNICIDREKLFLIEDEK